MKSFAKCLSALALVSLVFGMNRDPFLKPVHAQDGQSIEDVMEGINNDDFFFGSKEKIKQDNISRTKETNQEEILIGNSPELRALLGLSTNNCQIGGGTTCTNGSFQMNSSVSSGSVSFSLGGLVLESSVANSTVTNSATIASGSTQTLAITCNSPLSCTATFIVLSGATCPTISNVVITSGATNTFICTAS